jgi:class 3 adenylate cyclase
MAMLLVLLDFLPGWRNFFIPSPHAKILFILNSFMNSYTAWLNENSSRARFRTKVLMDRTHNRIETILHTLLPPEVVAQVAQHKKSSAPPSHQYVRATIAQSDLVGFTQLSSTRTPEEVVRFMDELFGLFDELTEKYGIYKVETIGDAYIAGQAEYPLTDRNKPISVVLFGLDMVRKTHEWARGMGTNVTCRVGIHTGECIGGIVGTEMQRYHLFGNLMSVVEVLESTAPEGKVQTSQACREACERQRQDDGLPPEALIFEPIMSEQLQTSKGEVHDFSEIGGRSYTVRCYAQLRSLIKI